MKAFVCSLASLHILTFPLNMNILYQVRENPGKPKSDLHFSDN